LARRAGDHGVDSRSWLRSGIPSAASARRIPTRGASSWERKGRRVVLWAKPFHPKQHRGQVLRLSGEQGRRAVNMAHGSTWTAPTGAQTANFQRGGRRQKGEGAAPGGVALHVALSVCLMRRLGVRAQRALRARSAGAASSNTGAPRTFSPGNVLNSIDSGPAVKGSPTSASPARSRLRAPHTDQGARSKRGQGGLGVTLSARKNQVLGRPRASSMRAAISFQRWAHIVPVRELLHFCAPLFSGGPSEARTAPGASATPILRGPLRSRRGSLLPERKWGKKKPGAPARPWGPREPNEFLLCATPKPGRALRRRPRGRGHSKAGRLQVGPRSRPLGTDRAALALHRFPDT